MTISQFVALVRPRTLTAALSPVILGAAYGYTQLVPAHSPALSLLYSFLILVVVVLAQMAANIWNEYFDYKSGLDATQYVGNAGLIAHQGLAPSRIKKMGYYCTFLALIIGLFLAASITWWYIPVGAVCVLISIVYSGGPCPLSRTPFGELASGLSMGLAIVGITAFAWGESLNASFLFPGIASTLLVGSLMMTNNLRDIHNDKQHGRKTLVILLGRSNGIYALGALFAIPCALTAYGALIGAQPLWVILTVFSLIPARRCIQRFSQYADPAHLDECMKFTAMTMLFFHLLYAIGLLLGNYYPL